MDPCDKICSSLLPCCAALTSLEGPDPNPIVNYTESLPLMSCFRTDPTRNCRGSDNIVVGHVSCVCSAGELMSCLLEAKIRVHRLRKCLQSLGMVCNFDPNDRFIWHFLISGLFEISSPSKQFVIPT